MGGKTEMGNKRARKCRWLKRHTKKNLSKVKFVISAGGVFPKQISNKFPISSL